MDAFAYVASSCDYKQGVGGWAAVLVDSSNNIKQLFGYVFKTTHNRLLLLAILNALYYTKANGLKNLIVFTDSTYLFKILKQRSYNQKASNSDLIKEIFKQSRGMNLQVELWRDDTFLDQAKRLAKRVLRLAYNSTQKS